MGGIDNRCSAQYLEGMWTNSHNTLSTEDLRELYGSRHLFRGTQQGLQARHVFPMALITAMRPTALEELITEQMAKERSDSEDLLIITAAVGRRVGASKTNPSGYISV